MTNIQYYDVIIVGGGAAGLFCASQAGKRGFKTLVLEKNQRVGLKILISGGGRCNFTNEKVSADNYLSKNSHFCKSALACFQPDDFIQLVRKYKIPFHEKHQGQLFCNHSSKDILRLLLTECETYEVAIRTNIKLNNIENQKDLFNLRTENTHYQTPRLVIATGGLSYKNLGASDFGYQVAKQFKHPIIPPRPALTPILFKEAQKELFYSLAGVSLPVKIHTGRQKIIDSLLFTHQGISGPAVLRISNYWQAGQLINLDFLPFQNLRELIERAKQARLKKQIKNLLAAYLPARIAQLICDQLRINCSIARLSKTHLKKLIGFIHQYQFEPKGLASFNKAEVTLGGISTNEINSKTMESKLCSGLYFIGEVLDVTGDLGGYNFQWAWSSAVAAASSF